MAAEAATFFHRTGTALGSAPVAPVEAPGFRPALFAHFHDLARLRYDFPLVLVEDPVGGQTVETLSGRVDALLAELAPPGAAGDRLRRIVHQVEREIRAEVADADRSLEVAWDAAAERVSAAAGEAVADELSRARTSMRLDGELAGCRGGTPALVVEHAWRLTNERRSRERLALIDVLWRRLGGLVEADFVRSAPGRSPALLQAGMGDTHHALFDFDVMSRLLAGPSGPSAVSPTRQRRIEETAKVLREQRFFGDSEAHGFVFDGLDGALAAYRERLPEMARLVKALAVAELELRGGYVEAEHDAWVKAYDEDDPGPEELALFPDYLVRLDAAAVDVASGGSLLGALAGGVPLKVVVAIDDPFGLGGQLAEMAMGLGDVFVLQASASQLAQVQGRVQAALDFRGPALMAIFTGAVRQDLPPYLVAAAAVESRAFPSFTYDPSAGPDWQQRLILHDNPQPDRAWPGHTLAVSDEAMQRVAHDLSFTAADFAICDPRQAPHFAPVPEAHPDASLVPVDRWLVDGPDTSDGRVPFVFALQPDGGLRRLIVDERLVRATRRRAEAWHRLRELDALKMERTAATAPAEASEAEGGEVSPEPVVDAAVAPQGPTEAVAQVVVTGPAQDDTAVQRGRDDPWIETPRCTTCNECTGINSRMFGYGPNQQAMIVDPDAGTYRELVEAAERCQVAIIHPGQPRNPNEPGLDELRARAEPFR